MARDLIVFALEYIFALVVVVHKINMANKRITWEKRVRVYAINMQTSFFWFVRLLANNLHIQSEVWRRRVGGWCGGSPLYTYASIKRRRHTLKSAACIRLSSYIFKFVYYLFWWIVAPASAGRNASTSPCHVTCVPYKEDIILSVADEFLISLVNRMILCVWLEF